MEKQEVLQRVIGRHFSEVGLELIRAVQIPKNADRVVQLQTLEDLMHGENSEDVVAYVVKLKSRRSQEMVRKTSSTSLETHAGAASGKPIYGEEGHLNIPYLEKNAEILLSAHEYGLAKNIFKAIRQSGKSTARALIGLGRCAEAENDLRSAEAYYEESIAYLPSGDVYLRLTGLLIRQGRDAYAAEVIERGLRLSTLSEEDRFQLYQACGNCHYRNRRYADAERAYQKALEVRPNADNIRSNLGSVYIQTDRLKDAIRCFQDAFSSNSNNAHALMGLGLCFLAVKKHDRAMDFFIRALDRDPSNATAIYHLVSCAFLEKKYSEAERCLIKYIDVSPVNPSVLYSLAGLQFHQDKFEESRNTLKRILAIKPEHQKAQDFLRVIEARLDN